MDPIDRQAAIGLIRHEIELSRRALDEMDLVGTEREKFAWGLGLLECIAEDIDELPSAQPEEVIPHRNYQYLSDYWCECGWHLGKKESVKYCAECGKKVKWDG